MGSVYFITTGEDVDAPNGGMRQWYRHCDILNQNGKDAAVAHAISGFRLTWFKNSTRTTGQSNIALRDDDCVVLSETSEYYPEFLKETQAKIVVYVQNPFNLFRGFGWEHDKLLKWYREDVSMVMCVSEHSERYLKALLPGVLVKRIKYSFDKFPFGLGNKNQKRKKLCYMPRKRRDDAQRVLELLEDMGALCGWDVQEIDGMTEAQTADVMKESLVFLSFAREEGFGMPAAEAMASGCIPVGFTGYAGDEFFLSGISVPVSDGDYIEMARATSEILAMPMELLTKMAFEAHTEIVSSYSSKDEESSIMDAWSSVCTGIPGRNSIFPLDGDVVALVSTLNEGPYLDWILRWLVPRVSKVIVFESETSYLGGRIFEEPLTKKIFDRIIDEVPRAKDVLVYRTIEAGGDVNAPVDRETSERKKMFQEIRDGGARWIWWIDADEVYSDESAEGLWRWFQGKKDNPEVFGVKGGMWTYWRSLRWRIEPREGMKPNLIIRSDQTIDGSRTMMNEARMQTVPDEVCMMHHYSWAKEPVSVRQKLATWTHALEVAPLWYDDVFMRWTPGCKIENLNPSSGMHHFYKKAILQDSPIPECLRSHPWSDGRLIEDGDIMSYLVKDDLAVVSTIGWPDDIRSIRDMVSGIENIRFVAMSVGEKEVDNVEIIDDVEEIIEITDVVIFSYLDDHNRDIFERFFKSGVSIVVREGFEQKIIHMKNGLHFGNDEWGRHWVQQLVTNPGFIESLSKS